MRNWDLKFGVEHLQRKIDEAIVRSIHLLKFDLLNKDVLGRGYPPSYDNQCIELLHFLLYGHFSMQYIYCQGLLCLYILFPGTPTVLFVCLHIAFVYLYIVFVCCVSWMQCMSCIYEEKMTAVTLWCLAARENLKSYLLTF